MTTTTAPTEITKRIQFVEKLIENNGPSQHEWPEVDMFIESLIKDRLAGFINEGELNMIRQSFRHALSENTLQGLSYIKRHGYAGDYEIVDKIYGYYISPDPKFRRWDEYFHAHDYPKALRNRKEYFKELIIKKHIEKPNQTIHILNVGSGPCRDLAELFAVYPDVSIHIDCIEMDPNAIEYATALLPSTTQVRFVNTNIFKLQSGSSYDLVWSGGLFNYLDDSQFLQALKKLINCIKPGGEIVVGNFQSTHNSFYNLKFLDWHLNYRSCEELKTLARYCGVPIECMKVNAEYLGVNLFLHMCKGNPLTNSTKAYWFQAPDHEETPEGAVGLVRRF